VLDVRHKGKAMLSILKQAEQEPSCNFPNKIARLDEYPGYKQIFKQVKGFILTTAEKSGLLPENLASKKQINQYLSWHFQLNDSETAESSVDILLGWRLALFGEKLNQFAANRFAD